MKESSDRRNSSAFRFFPLLSVSFRCSLLAAAACLSVACATTQPLDNSDSGIKARVEANLEAHRDLDLRYVTLDVHSRVVTVSGLVNSWNDQRTITRIVESTKGIDQAIINLVTRE